MNNPKTDTLSFFSLKMVADDEIRLSADAYWAKLVYNQTLLDKLWTAIKIASVGLALVSCPVILSFVRKLYYYCINECLVWSCSVSINTCKSESVKLSPEAMLKVTNGKNSCTDWENAYARHQLK